MKNFFSGAFGFTAALVILGFGILQLWAGWDGIEHNFGWGWAVAAVALAFIFRFTLPVMVGCYICAHDIWGWNWFFAALFAAPGLIFMIPNIVVSMFGVFTNKSQA
jgi:hypothetical protein